MTECPACFKNTLNDDGRCERCGVQVPKDRPPIETVGRRKPQRRPDQDAVGTFTFTDLVRYKRDHEEK